MSDTADPKVEESAVDESSANTAASILEVHGLRSGYHGVNVLKDINLDVGDEVFTILGANGAGKTTLLATIARLLPLTAGTCRFRPHDRLLRMRVFRIICGACALIARFAEPSLTWMLQSSC